MTVTIALAGDTMLGRGVARELERVAPADLVAPELADVMRGADLCVLNLECCVSERGHPWPDPAKPFFFRAPPGAVDLLTHLGVDVVTLANNHALDYGVEALVDTLDHLDGAGIRVVGAGPDRAAARRTAVLAAGGLQVAVVGVTDHPEDYAAGGGRPGVAYADLWDAVPDWLVEQVRDADADVTLVSPHWGPNMTTEPVRHVRRAADVLLAAGATVVAGHSAHVFHGVRLALDPPAAVLYDLGDFLDDYRVDPVRRNDLALLWLVTLDPGRPRRDSPQGPPLRDSPQGPPRRDSPQGPPIRVEALPLRLRFAYTEPATGEDRAWIASRLAAACEPYGTTVRDTGDRLVVHTA